MSTKKCSKCGEVKGLGEFYKNNSAKDGRGGYCKTCQGAATKKWRANNPEKVNNPEKQKQYRDNWEAKNFEKNREYREKYRKDNREIVNRRSRESQKRAYDMLSDSYIRKRLYGTAALSAKDIPPQLIELKREAIRIERYLKELQP